MEEKEYREKLQLADDMISAGDDLPYWFGFRRGTMRRYYGEGYGVLSDATVSRWIHTYDNDVDARCLAVQGFQDGLYGSENRPLGIGLCFSESPAIDASTAVAA